MKHFMVVVAFANILTASAEIVRSNDWFTVQWNDSDGTLSSLVMHNDKSDMNWIEAAAYESLNVAKMPRCPRRK